jgi:hypothetical protein
MFDGGTVRKPTGQGNHKLARELESKERIRLAKERDERRAAKERLNARTPLEIPRKGLYGRPRQRSSHIGHSTLKKQHARALRLSGVRPFVLYSLWNSFATLIAPHPSSGRPSFWRLLELWLGTHALMRT